VQRLLIGLGHDIGEPDGLIGRRSKEAIIAFNVSRGAPPTDRAGLKLLQALRAAAVPARADSQP
jgi:hypothetical protein